MYVKIIYRSSMPATFNESIKEMVLKLYNTKVKGKRIYRVEAIPYIIEKEFNKKITRQTIYNWIKKEKIKTALNE